MRQITSITALLALRLLCADGEAADSPMSTNLPAAAATAAAKPASLPAPRNLTAPETAKLLSTEKNLKILDVRTPEEFVSGHLAGATNLDFHGEGFKSKVAALDPAHPWLIYCASGGRSARARDYLKGLHLFTIYHLDGGVYAWRQAGLPLER